jgi:hypothetical protein
MLTLDKRGDDFTEMLESIPRETIATVGGEAITIPVEVPPAVPLAYTRTRMNQGSDVAAVWAMELLMRPAGFNTLLTAKLSDSDLDTLIAIIIRRVSGAATGTADEAPKASSNGAKVSPTRQRTTAARSRGAAKSQ